MNLTAREIFKILSKRWLIILLCSIFGFGIAFSFTNLLKKQEYIANTKIYVDIGSSDGTKINNSDVQVAQRLVNTYITILSSDQFLTKVAKDSGVNYSAGKIRSTLSMGSIDETEIFSIDVKTTNATVAIKIAKSIEKLAKSAIQDIIESGSVKTVDSPTYKKASNSSSVMQNSLIGFLVGFALSAAAVILTEVLDYRIKSEEDLENYYNIPLLGSVPNIKSE